MFPFQSLIHTTQCTDPLTRPRPIFFHPDFTVGFGVAPNHALRLVGCTTGWEMNPTLKIIMILYEIMTIQS